jgi:hypothetical protein
MAVTGKVRCTLDIIVSEGDEEMVQEMMAQFAANARARLSEFYTDADIIFATDDGLYEQY